MIRKFALPLVLAFTLLLTACAPAAAQTAPPPQAASAITLSDGQGREITLAAPAQKIVALAPSNTEILFAIGAGAQLIARDSFSDYPAEAGSLPEIGNGYGGLNTEVILSLEPDLVLSDSIIPAEQEKALEDAGLTVFTLADPADLDGMYENLRLVARLTGHEAETETLIASLKGRAAAVEAKTADLQERPLIFYELDGTDPNAPWTAGPGSFVDMLITMAGGENVGAALEGKWVQISLEKLIERDPHLILLGDAPWGGVTPEAAAARAGWEALTAVQAGRVLPFDVNIVSRPGPRLVDGLEALARLLHPELFQ